MIVFVQKYQCDFVEIVVNNIARFRPNVFFGNSSEGPRVGSTRRVHHHIASTVSGQLVRVGVANVPQFGT